MQQSRILNPKSVEYAILAWIRNYQACTPVQNLKDLADGVVFQKILSQIPRFNLIQQIDTGKQSCLKLHCRIKNMRIIYDSLKLYYHNELKKDTSKFTISLGELSNGGGKEITKFVQFIVGAIMWSDKKKEFLETILLLTEQHQETFMSLIKNAMNCSEDVEICGSGNKAKNLLERIDQLEEENMALCRTIDEMRGETRDKQELILSIKQQNKVLSKQNSHLIQQIQYQTPQKSSRESSRLEYKVLEQKINIQKNSYEARIKQLQGYLVKAEQKIQEIIVSEGEIKDLHEQINILTSDLQNSRSQLQKSINLLKDKDSLLIKLRTKNEQYQSRILKLEEQLQEQILKSSRVSFDSKVCEDMLKPLKSHRIMTCLRQQMNCIAQQLTIENSRLISQKVKKEQQYQQIILSQRQEIRKLKQSIHLKGRERKREELLSVLNKQNLQVMSNIDVGKLVHEFNTGHHQELMVLIQLLNKKTQQLKVFKQEVHKQKQIKQKRRKLLLEKANLINPMKLL